MKYAIFFLFSLPFVYGGDDQRQLLIPSQFPANTDLGTNEGTVGFLYHNCVRTNVVNSFVSIVSTSGIEQTAVDENVATYNQFLTIKYDIGASSTALLWQQAAWVTSVRWIDHGRDRPLSFYQIENFKAQGISAVPEVGLISELLLPDQRRSLQDKDIYMIFGQNKNHWFQRLFGFCEYSLYLSERPKKDLDAQVQVTTVSYKLPFACQSIMTVDTKKFLALDMYGYLYEMKVTENGELQYEKITLQFDNYLFEKRFRQIGFNKKTTQQYIGNGNYFFLTTDNKIICSWDVKSFSAPMAVPELTGSSVVFFDNYSNFQMIDRASLAQVQATGLDSRSKPLIFKSFLQRQRVRTVLNFCQKYALIMLYFFKSWLPKKAF
jgi:hypothetical protein